MADIVNLRQARKAMAKQAKEVAAEANRRHFGRSKAEKTLTAAKKSLETKALDGHKISPVKDET